MKKIFITVLLTQVITLSHVSADNWKQIKETAKSIKSINADFIQEKHLKILTRPLISKGKLFFSAPGSLRWEYFSPIRSILLMYNGKVESYIKGNNGFVKDSRSKAQAMSIVMQEITSWLNGNFQDNPNFNTSLKAGAKSKITLTPKEKSLANIIKRIELNILKKKGVVKSIIIYESEDSYTWIKFSDIHHNEKIDDTVFKKI